MKRDKVALVTGANRGLGRALAVGLAKDGCKVIATARSVTSIHSIAEEAGVADSLIIPLQMDLLDPESIASAMNTVRKEFDTIDILVNNAGVATVGTLDVKTEEYESLIAVNLSGPYRILKEVVPLMKRAECGHIFNVASRAGKIGFAHWGVYGASKFGLVGLSESLYRELVPNGVKVTALCPSWIDTDMARDAGSPLSAAEMIQTEDLMKTVRWLLSLSPAACVKEVVIECRKDIE